MYDVSIIVALYNVEGYATACLNSLVAQTAKNLQIILVDDGSTDKTGLICDEFVKQNSSSGQNLAALAEKAEQTEQQAQAKQQEHASSQDWQVIHQKNGGLSSARNTGIKYAQGRYISFFDGDDQLHPQFAEMLLHAAQTTNASITCCKTTKINPDKPFVWQDSNANNMQVISGRDAAKKVSGEGIDYIIMSCGKLYSAELIPFLNYPIGKLHEDEFVNYKLFYESERVAILDCPYYGITVRQGSITRSYNIKRLDRLEALEEAIAYYENANDTELVLYAQKRYGLAILAAYYLLSRANENEEKQLHLEELRQRFLCWQKEWYAKVKNLASLTEKLEVKVFITSPKLFLKLCGLVARN
jgi:glycosyltransferase involved in cell wall biosynthesis